MDFDDIRSRFHAPNSSAQRGNSFLQQSYRAIGVRRFLSNRKESISFWVYFRRCWYRLHLSKVSANYEFVYTVSVILFGLTTHNFATRDYFNCTTQQSTTTETLSHIKISESPNTGNYVPVRNSFIFLKKLSYPYKRPWRPIGLWGIAPTFSRQSAHRWRRGCQPYSPTALYPQEDSWYPFLLEAETAPVS
jgi:hypothetical protein